MLPTGPTGPTFQPGTENQAHASQERRGSLLPVASRPLSFEISTENTYSYQSFTTTPGPLTSSHSSFSIFPISGLPLPTTHSGVFYTTPSTIPSSQAVQTVARLNLTSQTLLPVPTAQSIKVISYSSSTEVPKTTTVSPSRVSPHLESHLTSSVATNTLLVPAVTATAYPSSATSATTSASQSVTTAGYSFGVDFDNIFSGNPRLKYIFILSRSLNSHIF